MGHMPALTSRKLATTFAVELRGIDLARHALSDEILDEIKAASEKDGVVVLLGQMITDEQQLAFTERFGTLEVTPGNRHRKKTTPPGIAEISNLDADGKLLPPSDGSQQFSYGNNQWHSDLSFTENGAAQSILSAREVPATGGETEFADMGAAYDALPAELKARIDNLYAEHSAVYSRRRAGYSDFSEADKRFMNSAVHSVVQKHPSTGRACLFMGAHAELIKELPRDEGRALLDELLEHAAQPCFVYSHRWAVGDLVIWDNRRVLHRRSGNYLSDERRSMRRTTVIGELGNS